MRILYFHQHFSTPAGATGLRSYRMAQHLISCGHQVTMVCGSYGVGNTGLSEQFLRGKRRGYVDQIDVIEFNVAYSNTDSFVKRTFSFAKFALNSIALVFTEKYDLVFASSTPLTAGIPGVFARIFRRKPFVFEVRDLWPELPREMGVITNRPVLLGMDILEWISYHCADRCIGLSPGIVEGIVRRGIIAEKVEMIPNGCDLETFDPTNGESWRPEQITSDQFIAVFTGTHGVANGLEAVLDAATELKKRGVDSITLVMIGHGKLKKSLVRRAKDEGLDNCIFLDSVPKERLAQLLRSADLGMMVLANVPAFYYGTSPNKFFDYIAAGLPVINNYPGWLAELISENDFGFAVPPDDPVAFADALLLAQSDHEGQSKKRLAARNLAEKEFPWTALAERFERNLLLAVEVKAGTAATDRRARF